MLDSTGQRLSQIEEEEAASRRQQEGELARVREELRRAVDIHEDAAAAQQREHERRLEAAVAMYTERLSTYDGMGVPLPTLTASPSPAHVLCAPITLVQYPNLEPCAPGSERLPAVYRTEAAASVLLLAAHTS